jgi:hypothetical protein
LLEGFPDEIMDFSLDSLLGQIHRFASWFEVVDLEWNGLDLGFGMP